MTREEFLYDVRDYDELREFCEDVGCDILDGVYDEDMFNEYIEDRLVDLARENTWRDLYHILNDYDSDSGYDYYIWDEDYCEYKPKDFDDLKSLVLDWADYEDAWHDDDEEEDYETEQVSDYDRWLTPEERFERIPTEEEDCTVFDMFKESRNCVQTMTPEDLDALGNGLRATRELIAE